MEYDQDEIIAAILAAPRLANDKRPSREIVAQWSLMLDSVRDWRARQRAATQAPAAEPEAGAAEQPSEAPAS